MYSERPDFDYIPQTHLTAAVELLLQNAGHQSEQHLYIYMYVLLHDYHTKQ